MKIPLEKEKKSFCLKEFQLRNSEEIREFLSYHFTPFNEITEFRWPWSLCEFPGTAGTTHHKLGELKQ